MTRLLSIATTLGITLALLPIGISSAGAVSYYPGYTCYYRDISGSCLSYQTSKPYFPPVTTYTPQQYMYPRSNLYNTSPWNTRQDYQRKTTHYFDKQYEQDGQWKWYKNADGVFRPYRYQSGNTYDNDYDYNESGSSGNYYDYEKTHITCLGRNCDVRTLRF